MNIELQQRLRTLRDSGEAAVYLKPPCTEAELERFSRRVREELQLADGAPWYLALLRFSNGLQIENSIFDSAEGCIENNLDHRRQCPAVGTRFLLLGSNGNLDSYVYDAQAPARPFLVANFYGDFSRGDEIFASFATLDHLVSALLNQESPEARPNG